MPITLTRSLLVILVPGGVAVSPWFIWVALSSSEVLSIYDKYPIVLNTLAVAAFVIIGSIFEGVGTHFEVYWDNKVDLALDLRENWYAYLAKVCATEPVGFRYISRMATTMYFELSMMLASVLFWAGVVTGIVSWNPTNAGCYSVLCVGFAVGSVAYFYWQARCSHRVLCEARAEIVKRM